MLGHFGEIGVHPSTVSSNAQAKVGDVKAYIDPLYGVQLWRHVYNASIADIAAYLGVDYDAGSWQDVGLMAADAPRLLVAGFTQYVLPTLYYGWVLCYGDGIVTTAGAVVQQALMSAVGGGGEVDDTAPANREHMLLGHYKTATTGATTTRAFIACWM